MDNPWANRSGFFHRRRNDSSTDLTSVTDDDTDASSIASKHSPKGKHHHTGLFARHIKMTPIDSPRPKKSVSRGSGYADAVKISYLRECERWFTTRKLNSSSKVTDPLTFSLTRLEAFLQLYDATIQGTLEESPLTDEKMDHIAFWSCEALKLITGMSETISLDILADFSNNDLKKKEKLKVIYLMGDYFTTQWSWQLAIDNPSADIYCYTLGPVLFTAISEYRTNIGPPNYHVIRGVSLSNIPFSKDSFCSAVCYDLWLHVKSEEWDNVLSEILRLLTPHGQVCLFLMDFTQLNCKNKDYTDFLLMVQEVLRREGIDPFPCKKAQGRLAKAGFVEARYAFVSLKRGMTDNLGSLMELLQGFFEYLIFTKIAQLSLTDEELERFKEMKIKYNQDLRNGELLEDFGDSYFMFAMAQKPL